MKVRPFQMNDEEQVIALWVECGLVVPQNDPHQDILRKLEVHPEWFLVGEKGGVIIGTCMAGYEGHRGWINYLAVHPVHRKSGYASKLMSEVELLLREANCPKINLQVRSTNAGVISFYESLGYSIDPVVSLGKRLMNDSLSSSK